MTPTPAPVLDRPTVVIRPEAFTPAALRSYGWTSLSDGAVKVGLTPSTMLRLARGESAPGGDSIAALIAGTGAKFDDLFAVAGEGVTRSAPTTD